MQEVIATKPMTDPIPAPPIRRWWPMLARLAACGLVAWFAWEIAYVSFLGNVHAVIPGQLYRGGQPSPAALETLIQRYSLRTVINVRGCCYPEEWYIAEAETCQRLGVHLEDITFSAMHLPSRDEVRELIEVLDRTEYPAFIHCRQGSDRTGVAAMIAVLLQENQPYTAARGQLGLRYGHVPVGKTTQLDQFFVAYERWLRETNQEHTPKAFRHWVNHDYRGAWCDVQFDKVERLFDTPRVGQSLSYRIVARNTSNSPWQFRPHKTAGIHFALKVINQERQIVLEERAGLFDAVVPVGETIQVTMVIPPIWIKGPYRICIDMIDEGHCWFHQTGSQPWEEELELRE